MTKTYDALRQAVAEALPVAEKDAAVAGDVVSALKALGILLNGGGKDRGGGKFPWEIMPGAVSRIDTFNFGTINRAAAASVHLDRGTQTAKPKRGRPRKAKAEGPAITDDLAETIRNSAIGKSENGARNVRVSDISAGLGVPKPVVTLALSSDPRFTERGRGWWVVKV
jgi:hypothetical protein